MKELSVYLSESKTINPSSDRAYRVTSEQLDELLSQCEEKDSKYHVKLYALGQDRGNHWMKRSDIEAYLRNYNDSKIEPIEKTR